MGLSSPAGGMRKRWWSPVAELNRERERSSALLRARDQDCRSIPPVSGRSTRGRHHVDMALVNLAQASGRGFLQHADERRARPSLVLAQIRALTFGTSARPL